MKTAESLQGAADRIHVAQTQVDDALTKADSLVNSPQADPRKQFEQFQKSLKELDATAKKVRSEADDMKKRAEHYFAQWEKDAATINNEDIKKVTDQRRAERKQQFMAVQDSFKKVGDAFQPFMADLKDIEKALSLELTKSNLEVMKPFVAKAKEDHVALRKASDDLIQQFKDLGVKMSPVPSKLN